jgi:hypothetical protein
MKSRDLIREDEKKTTLLKLMQTSAATEMKVGDKNKREVRRKSLRKVDIGHRSSNLYIFCAAQDYSQKLIQYY